MLYTHEPVVRHELAKIASRLMTDIPGEEPSLFTGDMGKALFLLHYSVFKKEEVYYDKAMKYLDQSFEMIDRGYYKSNLASGVSGIFWLVEHLVEHGFINEDVRESIQEFDQYLAETMLEEIEKSNFDFLHGALGIAFYLLKRRDINPDLNGSLEKFIHGLHRCAIEVDSDTVKWHNGQDETLENMPNISLSHGISSIAIMLSKFAKANIAPDITIPLLHRTVNYLLSQEIDPVKYVSYFPTHSLESHAPISTSRLAWCYGDLGVGLALYHAANAANVDQWRRKAIEVFTYSCSRKDLQINGIKDAGLCHGTAGLAHIFHRLYLDTGISSFKEATSYWHEQTLGFDINCNNLSGYAPYLNVKVGNEESLFGGFLMGISGIGLSLLHSVSDIPPAWDECLLLS